MGIKKIKQRTAAVGVCQGSLSVFVTVCVCVQVGEWLCVGSSFTVPLCARTVPASFRPLIKCRLKVLVHSTDSNPEGVDASLLSVRVHFHLIMRDFGFDCSIHRLLSVYTATTKEMSRLRIVNIKLESLGAFFECVCGIIFQSNKDGRRCETSYPEY